MNRLRRIYCSKYAAKKIEKIITDNGLDYWKFKSDQPLFAHYFLVHPDTATFLVSHLSLVKCSLRLTPASEEELKNYVTVRKN